MTSRPVIDDLSSFWMPFTANRQYKAAPRLLESAKGMYYRTSDGRDVLAKNDPLPDGGWVSTHTDVTEQRRVEQERSASQGHEKRRAIIDALPARLPQEAKPALERALARSEATRRILVAAMAETKGTIERLRSGRRVVGAYQRSGRAA